MPAITYYKPVSWSKFREALSCPKQLEYDITRQPRKPFDNFYLTVGSVVQRAFELYYEKSIFENPERRNVETLQTIADRIIESGWMEQQQRCPITYGSRHNLDDLRARVNDYIAGGVEALKSVDLFDKKVLCEVQVRSDGPGGLKIFGSIDFVSPLREGVQDIFDGKTGQAANPQQLLYYGLVARGSGVKIGRLAFIYYKTGKVVDVAPLGSVNDALAEFEASPDFKRGLKIFQALKGGGVLDLPATPDQQTCRWCDWQFGCPFSSFREVIDGGDGTGLHNIAIEEAATGHGTSGSEGPGTYQTGKTSGFDIGACVFGCGPDETAGGSTPPRVGDSSALQPSEGSGGNFRSEIGGSQVDGIDICQQCSAARDVVGPSPTAADSSSDGLEFTW